MKFTCDIKLLLFVFALSQTNFFVFAQDSNEEKCYTNSDRHWLAEIPIWVPGFRGQFSYGDFDFSSSYSDVERKLEGINSDAGLEFYFVGRISAQYNRLCFQLDAFSGEVGSVFRYSSLIGSNEKELVDVKIQGTIPRLVLGVFYLAENY